MNDKKKSLIIGIISGIILFLLFGISTALIPNPWFTRMVKKSVLDYLFLISSSALLGAYIRVHYYKRNAPKNCDGAAYSGGISSFLAFGCPICNKLLVLLFSAAALMTYFEPYRPVLGFVSIAMLGGALYFKIKR